MNYIIGLVIHITAQDLQLIYMSNSTSALGLWFTETTITHSVSIVQGLYSIPGLISPQTLNWYLLFPRQHCVTCIQVSQIKFIRSQCVNLRFLIKLSLPTDILSCGFLCCDVMLLFHKKGEGLVPLKSKNTKILTSEENSKRKIKNQKAKSKVQTHQTNG